MVSWPGRKAYGVPASRVLIKAGGAGEGEEDLVQRRSAKRHIADVHAATVQDGEDVADAPGAVGRIHGDEALAGL